MLQPRDIVAVFRDDPESGGTIGHYGMVVRVGMNALGATEERVIRVLVQGREIDFVEGDVLATGRIDDSNPSIDTSCSVVFFPHDDDSEERTGTYQSRAGSFRFTFRRSDFPVSTYQLRMGNTTGQHQGELLYNVASDTEITRAYMLRAIGEITGELALPNGNPN